MNYRSCIYRARTMETRYSIIDCKTFPNARTAVVILAGYS